MTIPPPGFNAGRLILITGTPASGKTTVAAALADRLPRAVFVDDDDIAAMVRSGQVGFNSDPSPEATEQLLLRYRCSVAVAQTYRRVGFDAVIADNVFGELLGQFMSLVHPDPLHVVFLHPSVETISAREAERSKDGYGEKAWQIEPLHDVVEHHTRRVGLWLDTSEQTVDQTVDLILARLDEAPLQV